MTNALINQKLSVDVPDGYTVLSADQLQEMYRDTNTDRWGMRNESAHHTAAVFYHKSNPLLAAIADVKGIAESTQKKLAAGLSAYSYQLKGFYPAEVCGRKAYGFSYSYVNQEIPTDGETVIFKDGSTCYTVYSYSRNENSAANHSVFEAILASMKL